MAGSIISVTGQLLRWCTGGVSVFINVFLWPVSRGSAGRPDATTRQGYHLLHWSTPEFAYWVASDLGLAELDAFARMLREADSTANGPVT